MECYVFIDSIINSIACEFAVDDEKSNHSSLILRIDLKDEEDVQRLLKNISSATCTKWIVYNRNSNPKRYLFRRSWLCHHSAYGKQVSSKLSTGCPASIIAVIKNVTKGSQRHDRYLLCSPPLSAEVTISLKHNHALNSAIALRMLSVSDEVKNMFHGYFNDGLTPGQAISVHENSLLCVKEYKQLANASVNPTSNQVYYLHKLWRSDNFGPYQNPFLKLEEKMACYAEKGATVKYLQEDSWAVLLVTDVMKRAHQLTSSGEIIFVDSSCSCEVTSSTLTVLLTATKAGAIPIAVLMHKDQTAQNYKNAFTLLKNTFPKCFASNKSPKLFMSDDSAAEKSALLECWPEATQLLCHFHVAQAEWRWLFSQDNKIPQDERPRLMKLFQAVMYADSMNSLNEAVKSLLAEAPVYPHFAKRFLLYFNRRKEWLLFDRMSLLTRNNNTNNYAEATIRIVKDVVLCRTKAYNVVALLEFSINVWGDYLKRKLLSFAYGRCNQPYILYKSLVGKCKQFKASDIIEVSPNYFIMQTAHGEVYIDTYLGVCSCRSGKFGAFCKHQCFLADNLKLVLPNMPAINVEDKHSLATLVLGAECPEFNFFLDLTDENRENVQESSAIDFDSVPMQCASPLAVKLCSEGLKDKIEEEFKRLASLTANTGNSIPESTAVRLLQSLKQVKNISDFSGLLFFKALKKSKRKISVQPTSLARRRPGVTRGSKRIPAGRPPKQQVKTVTKRKRNLSANIAANVRNVH